VRRALLALVITSSLLALTAQAQDSKAKVKVPNAAPAAYDPVAAAGAANPDAYDIPKLVAVQKRAFQSSHNGLTLEMGYLPIDAFNKGFILGAAYSYSLSDYTSWEVLNFVNSFNIETAIKGDLEALKVGVTGANTPWLDYVDYYATTGLTYTPLYNKSLLFNKTVLQNDFTFVLDAGAAKFHFGGMNPVFGGGLILRYYLSPSSSLKFDFREQLFFTSAGSNGVLSLILGYCFQFGSEPSDIKL
jgi:outer membrane beta-barrel protein